MAFMDSELKNVVGLCPVDLDEKNPTCANVEVIHKQNQERL
jgi:hypothetical protein